ncbi:hypothetical protein FBY40_0297 [Microbacterium sp. SLBN-154]|nr:hypothetical protein FBY40_0297 [Microbacterium sp. SLBN-154]
MATVDSAHAGLYVVAMESESEMGRTRYRLYMIIGFVVSLLFAIVGVAALLTNGGPVLGWVMIIAGLAIAVVSIVQLRRS